MAERVLKIQFSVTRNQPKNGLKSCSTLKNHQIWQTFGKKMKKNLFRLARKFKQVQAKKLVKSNKINFTNNFFDQIPFFAISKMAKFSIFELGKLPKMQFHEKKIDLFDFASFFAWSFLNFLVHSVLVP